MIDRRELLKSAAMITVGRALFAGDAAQVHFGCQTNAWPIAARDFSSVMGAIQKIRNYGYEGFETGFANVEGQFDRAENARRQLDAAGVRFFGVHIFLTQYDPATSVAPADLYQRVAIGGAKLGGFANAVSPSPWRSKKSAFGRRTVTFRVKRSTRFCPPVGWTSSRSLVSKVKD